MPDEVRPIVVGVDGSAESVTAARWAVGEARLRGRPVALVHAYTWPIPIAPMAPPPFDWTEATLREGAEALVNEAIEAVRADDVTVTGETLGGPAAYTLLEASRGAEMVVVGHRGRGGFAALLLGSTATAVSAHAHCPVAVVRPQTGQRPPAGLVLVGADGSPSSGMAVAFAFDEADRRGAELVILSAWQRLNPSRGSDVQPAGYEDPAAQEAAQAQWLRDWVQPWREKHPQVAVRWMLTGERPAAALVEAAGEASLVVVGSRGRGGFTGLLLGSVSQQVLNHAPCPVVVVR
jgi:nucleotide-binding universal stress UspA family protein